MIDFETERIIGHGSFGVVFQARITSNGSNETVAIKKVLQDRRFRNRELQIMRHIVRNPHPNIVALRHSFYSRGSSADEVYLNLVLEFIPETVYSIARQHQRARTPVPLLSVRLYMYQLARALAHIHGLGICHRDIKPQNLLVNPMTQQLKLCDFGSAKFLVPGEPNVAYICSRYYRAPELIFGCTEYTTAIDVWSTGCVMAELLLGTPLFPGSTGVDQLIEIIKVLGTPSSDELLAMNPNYQDFQFPEIVQHPWNQVFRPRTPPAALDLIGKLLVYYPDRRLKAIQMCAHEFFDELRSPQTTLSNGDPLPALFDFTETELSAQPDIITSLRPATADAAEAKPEGTSSERKEESSPAGAHA